jgi:2-phosphosulfolactate phosphatase
MRVDVSFTAPTESPGDRVCLVIDVLRATSVMAVLLGRGVQAIYPAASIDEGRRRLADVEARAGRSAVVLCGEEHALPPEGYDYGNSPGEFERVDLPPHAVVATTNGTPALLACREAPLVMPAAPLNASAALARAQAAGRDVLVVCAGLRGAYAEDDTLAAGLFVDRLVAAGYEPGTEAREALALYEGARGDLAGAFRRTEHGARLVEIGFDADIDLCASVDGYAAVGALTVEDGLPVIRPLIEG